MDIIVIGVALPLAVSIATGIHFARQRKQSADFSGRLRELLAGGELPLPEIVTRLGLKDGFLNRGKVITLLGPMVQSGEVVEFEPPGATVGNRLAVRTYRLAKPT